MIVGYARVSTEEQDLTIQFDALRAAGAERVWSEKVSGTTADRPQLLALLDWVREGDVLLVTRLDRFARSSADLHNMVAGLERKGVGFRCTEQAGIDTTRIHGKLMLTILGGVAQFETELRRERQREGIEQAKSRGIYKGSKPRIDAAAVQDLLGRGMRPADVARTLGINRASVYRLAR